MGVNSRQPPSWKDTAKSILAVPIDAVKKGLLQEKESSQRKDIDILPSRVASASFEDSPAKRRKTGSNRKSLDPYEIYDLDELGGADRTVSRIVPISQISSRAPSSKDQRSGSALPHRLARGSSNEYKKVEGLMNSNSYIKHKSFVADDQSSSNLGHSMPSGTSLESPINITLEEARERPKYRGTARLSGAISKQASSDMRRGYLETSHRRPFINGSAPTKPHASLMTGMEHRPGKMSPELRDSFVPMSRKPRTLDITTSSDELADPDDLEYGSVTRLPSANQVGATGRIRASPAKEATTPEDISDSEDRGNIKPTKFVDSHRKKVVMRTGKIGLDRERENDFSAFKVKTVIMNGLLESEKNDPSIRFTDDRKCLDIFGGDTSQGLYDERLRVQLDKVHSIEWAQDCAKIRLNMARAFPGGEKSYFEFTA